MNLSFSTKWPERMGDLAGKPNFFIEKIWQGLPQIAGKDYELFAELYRRKFGLAWGYPDYTIPKLHTIRYDPHDRWKPGIKIHPIINNRTKDRFQFAPVMECKSVQPIFTESWENKIEIKNSIHLPNGRIVTISVDSNESEAITLFRDEVEKLTQNDGFPSIESFFNYFNIDLGKGWKIIHWTDLKY